MSPLVPVYGTITGLALGLTGGGGTMLAMPFLVYGLGLRTHDAIAVSLVAVGSMAFIGALARWRAHQLQLHLGILFAIAGVLGAPLGALLGRFLSDLVVTTGFALVTLLVAARLWRRTYGPLPTDSAPLPDNALLRHAACSFDPTGRLRLTSHCLRLLIPTGLATGIISGLFGVGGGFVVVPALVMIANIDIRQATATSLLVVAMVSFSGATGAFAAGAQVDPALLATFAGAGVAGLELGSRFCRRIPERVVQRGFSVILVLVAGVLILVPLIHAVFPSH
jgi:uncharacterized membrane protein YfcA